MINIDFNSYGWEHEVADKLYDMAISSNGIINVNFLTNVIETEFSNVEYYDIYMEDDYYRRTWKFTHNGRSMSADTWFEKPSNEVVGDLHIYCH